MKKENKSEKECEKGLLSCLIYSQRDYDGSQEERNAYQTSFYMQILLQVYLQGN